jgi:signal peptidase I
MNSPGRKTSIFLVGFVIFLVVFAFALLTYTRRVEEHSMLPTLEQGDLVVIEKVPASSIHLGDIIVYGGSCSSILDSNGAPISVIHRVVNVTSRGFITKGDNNPYTDQAAGIATGPIMPNCIEGKVVFVVPYIELLTSLPYGLNYVLAAIIILAVVLYEIRGAREEEPQKGTLGTQPQTLARLPS